MVGCKTEKLFPIIIRILILIVVLGGVPLGGFRVTFDMLFSISLKKTTLKNKFLLQYFIG